MKSRLIGLGVLIGTALLGYLAVLDPLQKAHAGVESFNLGDSRGPVLVPIGVIVGVGFLFAGDFFKQLICKKEGDTYNWRKFSAFGWVVLIVGFAAGIALDHWLTEHLKSLGYQIKSGF